MYLYSQYRNDVAIPFFADGRSVVPLVESMLLHVFQTSTCTVAPQSQLGVRYVRPMMELGLADRPTLEILWKTFDSHNDRLFTCHIVSISSGGTRLGWVRRDVVDDIGHKARRSKPVERKVKQ